MLRHALAFSILTLSLPLLAAPSKAAAGKCAAGEESAKYRGYDVCKPNGGQCGKGRRNTAHHRFADLIVCENDPKAAAKAAVPRLSCPSYERPVYPGNASIKPFCEPVGRCGSLRVAVASEVPGKKMCIAR